MIKKYEELKYPRAKECYLCRKKCKRTELIEHEVRLYCHECHKLLQHKEPTIDEVKQQMKDSIFQNRLVHQRNLAIKKIRDNENEM